jgi:hypothetical protein
MYTLYTFDDYVHHDYKCLRAINEFIEIVLSAEIKRNWLNKHQELFNAVNIQPPNLPGIANSTFDRTEFEYIATFHRIFWYVYYKREHR